MNKGSGLLTLALLFVLLPTTQSSAAAPTPNDLGTLGGPNSSAYAVSGNIVVGNSRTTGNTASHAFAYDLGAPSPAMKDLGTLGGTSSYAYAVSGNIVVGASPTIGNALEHAFAYNLSAGSPTMQDLGPSGSSSYATDVSGDIVAGGFFTPDGTHAAAWDLGAASPTMRDLGTLGGSNSNANAVSGNILVGSSWVTGDTATHAIAYDFGAASPTMRDLGTVAGTYSEAFAVSGNIVVGDSYTSATGDPAQHAFAYDLGAASPTMRDLGTLGGSYSDGYAVSGNIVVGTSALIGDTGQHAFAYDLGAASPTMRDLGTLGGSASSATAVNGNIVVGYSLVTGNTATHAFAYDLGATSPTMQDLGTLGGSDTVAQALSGNIVVGFSNTSGDAATHAVVWELETAAATAPSAPRNVTAAAGDASASVSWTAPASDGGSAITGYSIVSSPAGGSATTGPGTTTASIGGLSNGVPYTFAVTASNAIGAGTSADSNAVTPQSGAAPPSSATGDIPAGGGSVSTDPGSGPTASDPVMTTVAVPAGAGGGAVTIAETAIGEPAPTSYQFFGQQIDITSTAGTTATNPLRVVFTLDASLVGGYTPNTIQIYRAESGAPVEVLNCTSAGGGGSPISPDPCVSDRSYVNGTDISITVLSSTASHWNAARAATGSVAVSDRGYSPATIVVQQGGYVSWSFNSSKRHSVTDSLLLGPSRSPLFDSGLLLSGTYRYNLAAAGSFAYASTVTQDKMIGTAQVPVRASPTSGGTTTSFTIIWATRSLPGYVFDAQSRFKPAGSKSWGPWVKWKNGVGSPSASFTASTGRGAYQFRARVRNASSGNQSGFSPEALISVS